jgi:hypothetical protein
MRFLHMATIASAVFILAIAGSIRPAAANMRSYGGSWPVTISRSQHSNSTGCLTLVGNGTDKGSASLVFGSTKYTYGTYHVIDGTLVATIQAQGYGQNAGLVFIGSASHGSIGPGVFDDVYGGEAFDEGALTFGMKGGC